MVILEIVAIVAVVALDIATKVLADLFMRGKISLIDGVLSFIYVENTGASFGVLKGQRWLFVVITAVSLVAFILWLIKSKKRSKLARFAVCLIVGGAIGNLFDRIALGYVRDFIYFELINFPVFNVADSALTIGVAMLIFYIIFVYKEPERQEKTAQVNEEEKGEDV